MLKAMNSKFLNDRSKMVANFKVFPNRTIGPDSTLYAEIKLFIRIRVSMDNRFFPYPFLFERKDMHFTYYVFFLVFSCKTSIKYDIIKNRGIL